MSEVCVIIPYAPLCPARTAALEWNVERWKWLLPDAQLLVSTDGQDSGPDRIPGMFNKPRAVNNALVEAHAYTRILVIADCDTTPDWYSIQDRVGNARAGWWSVSAMYRRLTQAQTIATLASAVDEPYLPETDDQEHTEHSWSGVVILPVEAVEAIGGKFDERFDGWSADDIALACALETLWGTALHTGTVWHLHHPRDLDNTYGRPGFEHARALQEEYSAAAGNRQLMRQVIACGA